MAHATAVILVVGLTESVLGPHTPRLKSFADSGRVRTIRPVFPAVTCTVQSSMLTGLPVRDHGVVGNGWFNREQCEVQFWKQSNRLVGGEKIWETARKRDPTVTTANLFWWFNMYSSAEYSVTPRPIYAADGRKIPDCYSEPAGIRDRLQADLGPFPLFNFWGPGSSIASSRWIAEATKSVVGRHSPTLTLVYLPHLDYALQRFGPGGPEAARAAGEIDAVIGDLIGFFDERGTRVVLVSEYGIEPVDRAVFPNRALREAGLLRVREERGGEVLDPGASRAFAVADHQCAQVYVRDPGDVPRAAELLGAMPGVERVLDIAAQRGLRIDHARAGELVVLPKAGAWCAYPYWLDDARAPDFARTVDIHRKPGYDPLELFIDPRLPFPSLSVARRLLARRIGLRTLMDVIPLDAGLVRGSHGRVAGDRGTRPVLITRAGAAGGVGGDEIPCESVREITLAHLFECD